MKHRSSRITALGAVLCLVGAGVVAGVTLGHDGPVAAGASAGTAFTLQAAGTGVELAAGGTTLVGASSQAAAGADAAPVAKGSAAVTPAEESDQTATASAAGQSQQLPRTCSQLSNPFPAPFATALSLGSGCSSASASKNTAGLPTATATGQVSSAGVSPSASDLPLPVDPGSTLASSLSSVLGTLPDLPTSGTPLATVLQDVAKAASTQLTSLVTANLGSSTSTVIATSATATATTQDSGSQLSILDGLGSGGGPLLTVAVGPASASSTLDRATGQVTGSDSPATVSVTVTPPTGSAQTYSIAPGQSQTFLSGTPLETTVAAGSGSATSGSGKGSASVAGATIDALASIGAGSTGTDGGLRVVLGAATTSVTGAVPSVPTAPASLTTSTVAPVATAASVTGATTVHTGEYWDGGLPVLLFGLSLLAGIGLVTRRRASQLLRSMISFARPAVPSAGGRPPGRTTGTSSVSPLVSGPARRLPNRRSLLAPGGHGVAGAQPARPEVEGEG